MKRVLLKSLVVGSFVVLLVGCGSTGVLPIGNNLYLIDAQGGSALQSAGRSKRNALREANEHCTQQRLIMNVIKMKAYDGIPGVLLPHTELTFECLYPGEDAQDNIRPDIKIQTEEIP